MSKTIGEFLKSYLISGQNNPVEPISPSNFNTLIDDELEELYPIIAYKGTQKVTIKEDLVDGFNQVFGTNFAPSDEIVYYVCLIRIVQEGKIYFMIRFAFGCEEDNVILKTVCFDNRIEAIRATSIPRRSFNDNKEMDVYIFPAGKRNKFQLAQEIQTWLNSCLC